MPAHVIHTLLLIYESMGCNSKTLQSSSLCIALVCQIFSTDNRVFIGEEGFWSRCLIDLLVYGRWGLAFRACILVCLMNRSTRKGWVIWKMVFNLVICEHINSCSHFPILSSNITSKHMLILDNHICPGLLNLSVFLLTQFKIKINLTIYKNLFHFNYTWEIRLLQAQLVESNED
jgi:hypothetical protein